MMGTSKVNCSVIMKGLVALLLLATHHRVVVGRCDGVDYLCGIDVSHYQGQISWDKTATDNISFAMAKVGAGGSLLFHND